MYIFCGYFVFFRLCIGLFFKYFFLLFRKNRNRGKLNIWIVCFMLRGVVELGDLGVLRVEDVNENFYIDLLMGSIW